MDRQMSDTSMVFVSVFDTTHTNTTTTTKEKQHEKLSEN